MIVVVLRSPIYRVGRRSDLRSRKCAGRHDPLGIFADVSYLDLVDMKTFLFHANIIFPGVTRKLYVNHCPKPYVDAK